jgi:glutamine cyclotransferase
MCATLKAVYGSFNGNFMNRLKQLRICKVLMLLTIFSASSYTQNIPTYSYKIVNIYPHDSEAFTQGLVYYQGYLYEGTGQQGQTTLRKVELKTGTVLQLHQLDYEYFGEGITIFDNRIIQLTWKSNTVFYYDLEKFIFIEKFYYPTEGWGITHDEKRLIMSDGTATLYYLDPYSFEEISRMEVRDDTGPVKGLNELEYVKGQILANVWPGDRIAEISPESGKVTGWIDLSGILGYYRQNRRVDVLNGIAYDSENDRLFVTGKYWPKLFEIKLLPRQ